MVGCWRTLVCLTLTLLGLAKSPRICKVVSQIPLGYEIVGCIVQMVWIVYFKNKTPSQAPAMARTSLCADAAQEEIYKH
jgi:hypothetical protein